MATAEQYAQWIVDNADKRGTEEFKIVAEAYKQSKQFAKKPEKIEEPVPVTEEKQEDRTIGGTLKDIGVTALKGAVGLPQAFVGLADIPTGGRVGKALEEVGFRPAEAQKALEEMYSPAQQAAFKKVQEAEGFLPTLKAAAESPSVPILSALESVPQMIGGGVAARSIKGIAPAVSSVVAAGAGEGLIAAGSAASQIRESSKDGLLSPKQSIAALGSGVGTAAFGMLGGKLASKFGLDDIDVMIAKGGGLAQEAGQVKRGFFKSVAGSGISEGAFEELPQSAQEQIWQNWATEKPLFEGVPEASALGMMTGSLAGGVGGGFGYATRKNAPQEQPQIDPEKYKSAIETVQKAIPDTGFSNIDDLKEAFKTAGIDDDVQIGSYLMAAQSNGDIQFNSSPIFEVQDKDGSTLFQSVDEGIANKAAEELNKEKKDVSVVKNDNVKITRPTGLEDGVEITKGSFDPNKFDIVAGNAIISPAPMEADEAAGKVQRLSNIRKNAIKEIDGYIKDLNVKINKNTARFETFEAEDRVSDPEYEKTKQEVATQNQKYQSVINELVAKKQALSEPLMVKPSKLSDDGFSILQNGRPVGSFATEDEAKQAANTTPESIPTAEAVQAKEALRQNLLSFLKQVGLENTGLRIIDSIESGQGTGDGYYSSNLIGIALDAPNPMETLRHETIHALKEMGAFTTQEWDVLQKAATNKWLNQFVRQKKNRDGKNLYEAYKDLYQEQYNTLNGFDEYVAEEAIAEAFKYFNANKAPANNIGKIFNKIKEFFNALKNSFTGLGFQTSNQIFNRIEKGQIKPRIGKEEIGRVYFLPETTEKPRYTLRDDFAKAYGQNAVNDIDRVTHVRQETSFAQKIAEAISPESKDKFRQHYINKYQAVEKLSKAIAKYFGKSELLADQSAIAAALMSDRASGVAAEAMKSGVPVYEKGYTRVSNLNGNVKGLIDIFAPMMQKYKDPFVFQLFQFYSAARRGSRLYVEGRERLLTPKDIAFGKSLEMKYPEFKTAFDEYQKFNKGVVKFLVDTGVLSQKQGDLWTQYSDYIPFYRQAEGESTSGPKLFQNLSGVKPTPKLKGGEGKLDDFLETIVRNTRSAIEQGMKNVAAQRIVRDIMRMNSTGIVMGQKLTPKDEGGPDVVTVRENGEDVRYRVADPLLVESMKSLHNMGLNVFWKIFSYPTKALRELVTREPGFILANLVRDSLAAWTISGTSMVPIVDTVKQFGQSMLNMSPEAKALAEAGVGTGYEFSGDVQASSKNVLKAIKEKSGIRSAKEMAMLPLSKVWDMLEKGSNASDKATRAEIYKKVLAETGNEAEAVYQALEVMNFSRMGSSPMIQVISAIVPFFNARVQGLDVLYRAGFGKLASANAKTQHKAFMVRAATIVALSMIYWMLARDTDEWKTASEETRDNYWIVGGVKIPIPFEIGVLFKVIPERILEYAFGNDTGDNLLHSAVRNIVSTLKIVPIPQAALPVVEEAFNYSSFFGAPIVGRGMENVAAPYQLSANTSLMAKKIGEATGMSPIRIDHVLQGYTGMMGSYAASMIDAIIRTEEDGIRPNMRLDQIPVLKRFLSSDQGSGSIDAFYSLKQEVDKIVRTERELLMRGNPEQYIEYMQKNGRLLGMKQLMSSIDKQMTNLRLLRNKINFATGMDPQEKREALDNIRQSEIALTSQIKEIRKQFEQ